MNRSEEARDYMHDGMNGEVVRMIKVSNVKGQWPCVL